MNEYKDNKDAFIYLDPPYMDSYNGGYSNYHTTTYNNDLSVRDNTGIYIYFRIFKRL